MQKNIKRLALSRKIMICLLADFLHSLFKNCFNHIDNLYLFFSLFNHSFFKIAPLQAMVKRPYFEGYTLEIENKPWLLEYPYYC